MHILSFTASIKLIETLHHYNTNFDYILMTFRNCTDVIQYTLYSQYPSYTNIYMGIACTYIVHCEMYTVCFFVYIIYTCILCIMYILYRVLCVECVLSILCDVCSMYIIIEIQFIFGKSYYCVFHKSSCKYFKSKQV